MQINYDGKNKNLNKTKQNKTKGGPGWDERAQGCPLVSATLICYPQALRLQMHLPCVPRRPGFSQRTWRSKALSSGGGALLSSPRIQAAGTGLAPEALVHKAVWTQRVGAVGRWGLSEGLPTRQDPQGLHSVHMESPSPQPLWDTSYIVVL